MGCDYFYGVQANQFTFYRVPKLFFIQEHYRNMSTDAKLLYGMLLDRMNLSARNGWLDQKPGGEYQINESVPFNNLHSLKIRPDIREKWRIKGM